MNEDKGIFKAALEVIAQTTLVQEEPRDLVKLATLGFPNEQRMGAVYFCEPYPGIGAAVWEDKHVWGASASEDISLSVFKIKDEYRGRPLYDAWTHSISIKRVTISGVLQLVGYLHHIASTHGEKANV
jgi:hypothetical protein